MTMAVACLWQGCPKTPDDWGALVAPFLMRSVGWLELSKGSTHCGKVATDE